MDKINITNLDYNSLFEKNYGVFSNQEQKKLRYANILIIGSGGIDGIVVYSLARMGFEKMTINEFDSFHTSNFNYQIDCDEDTIGQNKGFVTKESILKINLQAKINLIPRELRPDKILSVIKQEAWDVIIPAADSWPLSVSMLDAYVDAVIPVIMLYLAGVLGRGNTLIPVSPAADILDYKRSPQMMELVYLLLTCIFYYLLDHWLKEKELRCLRSVRWS